MKNKHRVRFKQAYKWWDYTYLLMAVEDWCSHASKMHIKEGHLVNNESKARVLLIMSTLCKRIREDDYEYSGVFAPKQDCELGSVDIGNGYRQLTMTNHTYGEEAWHKYVKKDIQYQESMRQQDLDYLCRLVSKYLFGLWD